eukprot:scaffold263_cov159-Amphora_coffeaeformis.AAC.4
MSGYGSLRLKTRFTVATQIFQVQELFVVKHKGASLGLRFRPHRQGPKRSISNKKRKREYGWVARNTQQ